MMIFVVMMKSRMIKIMDCPVYNSQLRYDIEHIDEIKNITYRCLLKNKLGIPRTEKDNKELQEFQDNLNNCLSMSQILH